MAQGERKPLPFKQRDISRAMRGIAAGGGEVDTVKINPKGEIEISVKRAEPEGGDRAA